MSRKGNEIFAFFFYCSYPIGVPIKAVKCLNFCLFSKTCVVNNDNGKIIFHLSFVKYSK